MSKCGNLWAVGFDDTGRAAQVRDEITKLGWEKHRPHPPGRGGGRALPRRILHVEWRAVPGRDQYPRRHRCALPRESGAWRAAADRRGRRPVAGRVWRRRGRGRNQRRLRPRGGGSDQARDFCAVCPGRGRGYGCHPARDTRTGRDGVEDQRGPGAGKADSVHAGCFTRYDGCDPKKGSCGSTLRLFLR